MVENDPELIENQLSQDIWPFWQCDVTSCGHRHHRNCATPVGEGNCRGIGVGEEGWYVGGCGCTARCKYRWFEMGFPREEGCCRECRTLHIRKSPSSWHGLACLVGLACLACLAARNPHLPFFLRKLWVARTISDFSELKSCQKVNFIPVQTHIF